MNRGLNPITDFIRLLLLLLLLPLLLLVVGPFLVIAAILGQISLGSLQLRPGKYHRSGRFWALILGLLLWILLWGGIVWLWTTGFLTTILQPSPAEQLARGSIVHTSTPPPISTLALAQGSIDSAGSPTKTDTVSAMPTITPAVSTATPSPQPTDTPQSTTLLPATALPTTALPTTPQPPTPTPLPPTPLPPTPQPSTPTPLPPTPLPPTPTPLPTTPLSTETATSSSPAGSLPTLTSVEQEAVLQALSQANNSLVLFLQDPSEANQAELETSWTESATPAVHAFARRTRIKYRFPLSVTYRLVEPPLITPMDKASVRVQSREFWVFDDPDQQKVSLSDYDYILQTDGTSWRITNYQFQVLSNRPD